MPEDVIRLERNGLIVDVSPLGGAILSAHWRGVPILAPTRSPGLASRVLGAEACFPLVPFGNRIENNSFHFEGQTYVLAPNTADPLVLHGDGWLKRWTTTQLEPGRVVLDYRQEVSTTSPFAYEATETITLDDDGLTLSLMITNRAEKTLPYGLGFHPYFPRTAKTRIFACADRYWQEREYHLPDVAGSLPQDLDLAAGTILPDRWLNNAFDGWDGRVRIEWPDRDLVVSLEADDAFHCFTLYAPSTEDDFFCFEPMTHRPNTHHEPGAGGLVPLAPGESMRGVVTVRCRRC